ncbi:type I phosphomannose isomerase catalytic subunit [Calditerricola satsumensis]|uniref:Mannose-6-phosphate isomerase n=1 Tax=Calditerricola satsumensis TaxID=373054 RepID=A0A8J3B9U5_9BACI|nr:type I phosphomannose isomerase catalytic subunit [Calditerricola satsumensis]GGJ95861.1 mannose-6-phosphate isomerase [Calditerricola satsumensis]
MEPLLLQGVAQTRVWGGAALARYFPWVDLREPVGEVWVLSTREEASTPIRFGQWAGYTLAEVYQRFPHWFGRREQEPFPWLVKWIAAQDVLSVQLHPDDEFAQQVEGVPFGKTECWYVVDAEPGAHIYLGKDVTVDDWEQALQNGTVESLLEKVPVQKGDFIYLPAGTVHALGPGVTVVEVQQNSDITYRLYDWNRVGLDGKPRELHWDKAKSILAKKNEDRPKILRASKADLNFSTSYFCISKLHVESSVEIKIISQVQTLIILHGEGYLQWDGETVCIKTGDSILLPHLIQNIKLEGGLDLLVVKNN